MRRAFGYWIPCWALCAFAACSAGGNDTTGTGGAAGAPPMSQGGAATGGGGKTGGAGATGGRATGGADTGGGAFTGGRGDGGAGGGQRAEGGAARTGGSGVGDKGGGGGRGATGGAGGAGGAGASTGGGTPGTTWVGTWSAAPQLVETANLPPASLANGVLRQLIHVSLGGSTVRVRFTNEFGNGPVTIKSAHVAACKANPVDSSIDGASDKALAFAGQAGTTIAMGQSAWSDAVDFAVADASNLAVTMAFGAVPTNVTGHPGSRTTSYEQTNSTNVSAASMTGAQKVDHWYFLSGLDVADDAGRALVILGDSITDGRGSTTNGNNRWPDALVKRLQANSATRKVAVLNQGIGGNTLADPSSLGPTALERYKRDILDQSGVRWILVYEGVNDLGAGASAASVTTVYEQLIAMAHARQLPIYGATITPFYGHSYYSAEHEAARQTVNTYIRSGKFDAFVDFDAAVRDPASPTKLQAAYDMDGLHMNPAGYQKLADTVDLKLLAP